jgi:hypothetical protein
LSTPTWPIWNASDLIVPEQPPDPPKHDIPSQRNRRGAVALLHAAPRRQFRADRKLDAARPDPMIARDRCSPTPTW